MLSPSLLVAVAVLLIGVNTDAHVWHRNEHHEKAMRLSMLSENRYPKQSPTNHLVGVTVEMLPPNVSDHQLDVCEECKTVVQELADILKDPQAVARYKRLVKMVCLMATGHAAECEAFVEGFEVFLESMQQMMKDPQKCCKQLHLCTDRPNIVSRVFLLALKSLNFEIHASQTDMSSVDILCDECLFMSNELAAILSDPNYQKNLEDLIKRLCTIIPQVKDECETAIDSYAPAVFQEILEYLANPRPFCQKMGMCRQSYVEPSPLVLLTAVDQDNSATLEQQKPCPFTALNIENGRRVCVLCEMMVEMALDKMKENEQLMLAENVAMSLCYSLPSEWTHPCVDWVSNYFAASLLSMLSDISASKVCRKIEACSINDQFKLMMLSNSERQLAACDACKAFTAVGREWLQNSDYVKSFENSLTELCKKSPTSAVQKCHLTTEKYVKKMNALAAGVEKADTQCYKLGICKAEQFWWRR